MKDITAVMITVDRRPKPNYLAATLENLARSGWAESERLSRFIVVDSGPGCSWVQENTTLNVPEFEFTGPAPGEQRNANKNVAAALSVASQAGTPWVLFLEDDIDVCDRFFDGAGAWLDEHARVDRRVYPLAANYHWVFGAMGRGESAANYPLNQFYGTQALAMSAEDAAGFAEYLAEHSGTRVWQTLPDGTRRLAEGGSGYDLIMGYWHRKRYPEIGHFLTPCPSFVQHIGMDSVILPREGVHTFPSWPGRGWSHGQPLPSSGAGVVA